MIRAFTLMAILGITMSSCEGQPKTAEAESASVVFVNDTANQKIDVQLNGTLFTSYHYQASLPKPVLFPLVTASGKTLTRGFPIDPQPGERVDHPHHMGHWFNYGDVNGLDFWNNSDAIPEEKLENYGKIVHSEIVKINQEEGSLITKSSWQNIAGESADETTVLNFLKRATPESLIDIPHLMHWKTFPSKTIKKVFLVSVLPVQWSYPPKNRRFS